ncbi:MAG: glycosyltransferase family 39 protein, partial [Flavobacteriales bacterium]|nr:glycosyltransferase family 39 protein [Flavobacteriales bacterium]
MQASHRVEQATDRTEPDGPSRIGPYLGRWGTAWLPGEPWLRATFLALLALAAILRLWRLWEMPFMHDELSALVRLYPSLRETVVRGVIELDTHPPGVQVFEWCWTRLFGLGPLAVKLPFVLMGLAALPLIYRTGMAWTGAGTALLAVALLAVLQYGVLYGQLARPYAAGLFTTALCADQCTRWLASGRRRHLVAMGLGVVLSAYTHHFALLLAGIMCLSVLPLIPRRHLRAYLFMLLCCALLYAPNLPILFTQLGLGGLAGWLAPPGRHWVPDHLWWVAHTTWWLAAPLLVLLGWAVVRSRRMPPPRRTALLLLSCWGLLPLLIGLGYSAWRAPVIQHSVLMFSFPYMVLALFIGLSDLGRRAAIAVVALIAVAGTATLIITRQHYATAYSNTYRVMLDTARNALQGAHGPGRVVALLDAPDPQLDFLLQHGPYDPHMPHTRLRKLAGDHGRLDSLLRTVDADIVVYGEAGASPEQLARIQLFFPEVKALYDPPEGRVLVLGRHATAQPAGTR